MRNLGGDVLTLTEPISVPNGFSLVSGFGVTSLATDESTTFAIQVDAAASGSYSGEISFGNNDPDESPFNFTVQAMVEDPPAVQIIDNGDAGFDVVGAWTRWTGQGYENDIHESLPGTGTDVASWVFVTCFPATTASQQPGPRIRIGPAMLRLRCSMAPFPERGYGQPANCPQRLLRRRRELGSPR